MDRVSMEARNRELDAFVRDHLGFIRAKAAFLCRRWALEPEELVSDVVLCLVENARVRDLLVGWYREDPKDRFGRLRRYLFFMVRNRGIDLCRRVSGRRPTGGPAGPMESPRDLPRPAPVGRRAFETVALDQDIPSEQDSDPAVFREQAEEREARDDAIARCRLAVGILHEWLEEAVRGETSAAREAAIARLREMDHTLRPGPFHVTVMAMIDREGNLPNLRNLLRGHPEWRVSSPYYEWSRLLHIVRRLMDRVDA